MTRAEIDLGISRITQLLHALGNPHQSSFKVIHIAGTNGKGSVSAYISSILSLKHVVGTFNSPHLIELRDSIKINGETVDVDLWLHARGLVDSKDSFNCTCFERLVATAFVIFQAARCQWVVVECGMGGLLDATNVSYGNQKALNVITSISLDHCNYLGNSVEEIAAHKAGIINSSCPTVISCQQYASVVDIISKRSHKYGSPLYIAEPCSKFDETKVCKAGIRFRLPLNGCFQMINAATAIDSVLTLELAYKIGITNDCIKTGIEATKWPGRMEYIKLACGLNCIVDGAHNSDSIKALSCHIQQNYSSCKILWIIAFSGQKDFQAFLEILLAGRKNDPVRFTEFSQPEEMEWIHAASPKYLESLVTDYSTECYSSIKEAMINIPDVDLVVICGSLYLVSDFYRLFNNKPSL